MHGFANHLLRYIHSMISLLFTPADRQQHTPMQDSSEVTSIVVQGQLLIGNLWLSKPTMVWCHVCPFQQ